MSHPHLVTPGSKVDLREYPTRGKEFHSDRKDAERDFDENRDRLAELQYRLYAEHKRALLVVLQGTDASGKDGTIRHVFKGVNPQGVRVASFKEPTPREIDHDFLWRVHVRTPRHGYIGVLNRSYYEDVLIVRAENLQPKSAWEPRYDRINEFEQMLTESGTTILKFFLHISPEEQMERFRKRLDDPNRFWKFSPADIEKRQLWDEYRKAFEAALSRCSTRIAPWYVIPADQKWYRNYIICKTIVDTLEKMNPQFPESQFRREDFKLE